MMSRSIVAEPIATSSWRGACRQAADYLALTKPRVVLMVLITTSVGFYLGSPGYVHWLMLLHTLVGVALASAGTLALNQYLERGLDARMRRTQRRPLPDGRLRPSEALTFGLAMTAAGLLYLTLAGQLLSGLLTSVSVGSYIFLYTPPETADPFCLIIGDRSGALPPVTGWVAAAGELPLAAWTLLRPCVLLADPSLAGDCALVSSRRLRPSRFPAAPSGGPLWMAHGVAGGEWLCGVIAHRPAADDHARGRHLLWCHQRHARAGPARVRDEAGHVVLDQRRSMFAAGILDVSPNPARGVGLR